MILRSILIWVVVLLMAVLNGVVREGLIRPQVGEQIGRIISTVMLCAVICLVTWFSITWIKPGTTQQALFTGILWVVLTLAFEFLAGHYLFHKPWSELLADYNLLQGRIWVLVLITNLLAPLWAFYQKLV